MKKLLIICIFLISCLAVFSQSTGPRRSILAILPFEAGTGANAGDAVSLGNQLMNELQSWDALNLLTQADGSEYLVRGRLERVNNQYVLSATTYETRTNRALNNARVEAASVAALSSQIFVFAAQVTENVPFPNYLAGKWRAQIDMPDGPLTCILEFRSNGTISVEQYDTWEHRGENALRYQGFGTGTYSFWGYARRIIRGSPVDGFVTINLALADTLPKYSVISHTRVNYGFNEDRTVFQLVDGGFGCGDNYSGPSVYPGEHVAYAIFTKIQ